MSLSSTTSSVPVRPEVTIRPLREDELAEADRIVRLAFGTFLGMPDPLQFMGDADYARTRWRANPSAALAAELNGELAGTNFLSRWGSVGFFGPLTIRPNLWDRGIAQKLLRPTMEMFAEWGVTHAGLFTFATSTKHVSLYQKFGFWPRFLTALMEFPLGGEAAPESGQWTRFSALTAGQKESCLSDCREVTDSIYSGLDLELEIRSVDHQKLGDTLLLSNGSRLVGFAVCHAGAGTEAGSGKCYLKFGAVRCGPNAPREFRRLIEASRDFARQRGAVKLSAGVNCARIGAYQEMLRAGFRSTAQGVVMELNGNPGYNRPEVLLVDDWR
jgi:GNAT superfamily N-acetyltransferase